MENIFRVYVVDSSFSPRAKSGMESRYKKKNEWYKNRIENLRNNRILSYGYLSGQTTKNNWHGVVDFIPSNKEKDITKSADIFLYLYNDRYPIKLVYKSSIKMLCKFLLRNNIKNIILSNDDVKSLINRQYKSYDIINDIKDHIPDIEISLEDID